MQKADIALVGGDPMARLVMAVKLRREGFSVHSELSNRKRTKMFKAARENAVRVVELDAEE